MSTKKPWIIQFNFKDGSMKKVRYWAERGIVEISTQYNRVAREVLTNKQFQDWVNTDWDPEFKEDE